MDLVDAEKLKTNTDLAITTRAAIKARGVTQPHSVEAMNCLTRLGDSFEIKLELAKVTNGYRLLGV